MLVPNFGGDRVRAPEAPCEPHRPKLSEYLVTEGLEAAFARRIRADSPEWFAELGAATGPISHLLEPDGIRCVAIDLDPPPGAFSPMVCGDLRQLPLPTARFDAVSAVNCLYFLDDPSVGVREAHRVLRPGGLFLTSAPSRYHDPELRHVLPDWGERSPFDAEEVAEIVAGSFEDVVVEPWEEPAYYLRDQSAVTDYLVAFKIPDPGERATLVETPTYVTKSGVNVWARR